MCRRSWIYEARILDTADLLAAVRLLLRGRLRITRRDLHHPAVLARLRRRRPDVGLHAMGVIYRRPVIECFRLGILNAHIGLLPAYRGRAVMEWSLLEGQPTGASVFFVDEGIDTGPRIVLRREIPVDRSPNVRSAKAHLFALDAALFGEALDLLSHPGFAPLQNDGSGHRYYFMSRLFSGVVDSLLAARAASPLAPQTGGTPGPAVDISRTSP